MGTYVAEVVDPAPFMELNNNATIKAAGSAIASDLDTLKADIQAKLDALATIANKPPAPDYQDSVGETPAPPDFAAMDAQLAALRTTLGLDTFPTVTDLPGVDPFAPIATSIDVTFVDPELPAAPSPEILYAETEYVSAVLDGAKAWLLDILQNGGTGLNADVEQQIWDRARDRTSLEFTAAQDKILADTAARGFSLPQGATVAAINEAFRNAKASDAATAREVAVKQAELAQNNTQFAVTQAGALEATLLQNFNAALNRALDLAKSGAQLLVDVFNARMNGAQIAATIQKIKADVAIAEADVTVRGYQAAATKYDADIRLVEATSRHELGTLQAFNEMYKARMQELVARLDADVRKYLGEYDTRKQEWALAIENFRANVGLYEAFVREDGSNKQALSQVWGSLLSAVAHGLSVNYSLSASDQQSKGYSGRMSIDNSLTESHSF